jgi:ketosteroid isomerase-like protein
MSAPITPPTAARSADVEREVLAVVREWNAAFARNDVEHYFSFVHPEITVLTPGNPYRVEGLEQDREEFLHGVETGRSRVTFFQMLLPRVQVHGQSAVVTYFWRGSLGADSALLTFKETDVFVREPDGWKLLHVHLSRSG